MALLLFVVFYRSIVNPSEWAYTHWVFSYDQGILKRGLTGEILQALGIHPSFELVRTLSRWNVILIFSVSGLLLLLPAMQQRITLGWALFAAAFITSPAVLQNVSTSVARLNNIALLVMLLVLLVLPRLRAIPGLVLLTLAGLLTIALHEASFFLLAPFMIGVFVYTHRLDRRALWMGFAAGVLFALFLAFLSVASARSGVVEADHVAYLQARYPGAHRAAVWVLFTPVEVNIRMTVNHGLTMSNLWHHLIFVGVVAPLLIPLWRTTTEIVHDARSRDEAWWSMALLLVSTASPLALYLLGFDFFRWQSACLTNLMVAIILLSRQPHIYAIVSARFRADWVWVITAAVFGLLAGGAADYYSFDWAKHWLGSPR